MHCIPANLIHTFLCTQFQNFDLPGGYIVCESVGSKAIEAGFAGGYPNVLTVKEKVSISAITVAMNSIIM